MKTQVFHYCNQSLFHNKCSSENNFFYLDKILKREIEYWTFHVYLELFKCLIKMMSVHVHCAAPNEFDRNMLQQRGSGNYSS